MDFFTSATFLILGAIAFIAFLLVGRYVSLWFQAFVSGAPVRLSNIIGMSLRKIPTRLIVMA
jgi:uncharacterized protein YqfA (UPF0365 family)